MHIATLGDVMLDVIVNAPDGLHEDDDVKAQIESDRRRPGRERRQPGPLRWAPEATVIGPRAVGHDGAVRRRPPESRPGSA